MVASICDSVNSHLLNNIRDLARLIESTGNLSLEVFDAPP